MVSLLESQTALGQPRRSLNNLGEDKQSEEELSRRRIEVFSQQGTTFQEVSAQFL